MTEQMHTRKAFGISDIGLSRSNNEDVWTSIPEYGFFAIADGMGGQNAGEIAAQETIRILSKLVKEISTTDAMELIIEMRYIIERANSHVYQMGLDFCEYRGMGTTLCCLLWTKGVLIYAHVGDSRIYRLRDKKLSLLTQDHSLLTKWLSTGKLAETCKTPFPYRHVITRSIGCQGKSNPEIALAKYKKGDLFILCSDGISDVLSIEEMESILNREPELETAANLLIETAKTKESTDNMTLVIVS